MGRMTRTKEGDNKGRETIAKRRESDVRASGQMRKIIGGILGEKGKDKMYEERGAGMWKKGRETNGKGNMGRDERDEGHKDVGAGPNQREEEREEGRGEKEKGGGAYLDQDTEGGDGGYSYPLVTPGLGEVLDNITSELCAGTDRSTVQYHGTMVNPSYSQHLEGGDGTDMGNVPTNDTHHNTHGAPSEGHNK